QNMLIGQSLRLSFAGYLFDAGIPSALGLAAAWWIIKIQFKGRWEKDTPPPAVTAPTFDRWQSMKGLLVITVLVVAFLAAPWPRDMLALLAAGILLCSRRMASREILGLVDWQLLVLFVGLFVVNGAFRASGMLDAAASRLTAAGIPLESPAWLFALSAILSNIVSNVPATMLLLPFATHPMSGAVLALSSTLAGNLIIVGSIANIIVVDQAARYGVRISWSEHARTGIPVTLATLAIAAAWLWLMPALCGV
ncbi:MAG: SLC13 family permease, partial [Planctomycetota bacterium]|nr:SLC13 family permease [Planctomycetota bacterium]